MVGYHISSQKMVNQLADRMKNVPFYRLKTSKIGLNLKGSGISQRLRSLMHGLFDLMIWY